MLSKEELQTRKGFANGSEAGTITGDDEQKKIELFLEKTDQKEPEDLTFVQPVRFGEVTEGINIEFSQQKLGKLITSQQQTVTSDEYPWLRATLDGMVDGHIVECKCVSAFAKKDEIRNRYFPQVQQQMLLVGASKAYLCVFFGTLSHEIFEIEADPIFQSQLADVTRKFMECVKNRTPPVVFSNVHVPVEPIHRVDMSASNEWGNSANIWISNQGYAKSFDEAAKTLKSLTPADAVEAYGAGLRVMRSKSGSLSIRKDK